MKLDILAIGVHPDDVELGCGGILLLEKFNGKKIGILDLTHGELGTRGTAQTRDKEAKDAAAILQLDVRENLGMADGFFKNDEAHQLKVITAIRKYQPEIIICNAPEDRHPDHGRAGILAETAAFLSGLVKIETISDGKKQDAWRPKYVLHYIQDRFLEPDVIVDISAFMEKKLDAVRAYKTQFYTGDAVDGPQTYISSPDFLDSIIYRAKMLGKMIGVSYAEGFLSKKKIGIKNFDALILEST